MAARLTARERPVRDGVVRLGAGPPRSIRTGRGGDQECRALRKPCGLAGGNGTRRTSRATALLVVVAAWVLWNFIDAPTQTLQVMILGLCNGALYALIALGYTLVYGIIELINFAHGDLFMLGSIFAAVMIADVFGQEDVEPAGMAGVRHHLPVSDGLLRIHQHRGRPARLSTAPQRTEARTADHRGRRLVHLPEHRHPLERLGPAVAQLGAAERWPHDRVDQHPVDVPDDARAHDPAADAADAGSSRRPARARRCAQRRRTPTPRG